MVLGLTFITVESKGDSPREAFKLAIKKAKKASNSMANKTDYIMASYNLLSPLEANLLASNLSETLPYSQKLGPLGCIRISNTPKQYLFFGWV